MTDVWNLPTLHVRELLIAAALALALASCDQARSPAESAEREQAELREQIVRIFKDPARSDRILGLINEWRLLVAEQSQINAAFRQRLDTLNADYGTTRSAFKELYEQRIASEDRFIQASLAFRGRFVAEMTPEEWDRFARIRSELRAAPQGQP